MSDPRTPGKRERGREENQTPTASSSFLLPLSPGQEAWRLFALAQDLGLGLLPMHSQRAPGVCDCGRGAKCGTPGKHPRVRWAQRPADPPDELEMQRWCQVWPDTCWGLLLGNRLCCLDIDEHGEEHGLDSLHELERACGALPITWRALTPSGGLHVYFALASQVRATTHALAPGVQLRAGRHVMAIPPSDGREWELAPDEVTLASLPAWVAALVRRNEGGGGGRYLPLAPRIPPNNRHASYLAVARVMARCGLPADAITAALTVTDRQLGQPPKNNHDELRRLADWAVKTQQEEQR